MCPGIDGLLRPERRAPYLVLAAACRAAVLTFLAARTTSSRKSPRNWTKSPTTRTPDHLGDAPSVGAVGYWIAAVGEPAPRAPTDEWVERRFEARRTPARHVRTLDPCDGYVGYALPNRAVFPVREDVSDRLTLSIEPDR